MVVGLGEYCFGEKKNSPRYRESESRSVVSDTLQPHGLYSPWNSPGQNIGVGNCFLLQGFFPTQGLNWCLLHYSQILYQLSHQGSPRILEWVAYPFSSGSSWPRNWTGVSCITGGFFTSWATRESPESKSGSALEIIWNIAKIFIYFLRAALGNFIWYTWES